ncbi:MAG: hypothetical protein U9Q12_00610 [Patescibacteria group bacterium]|nr:hypothetical protein [Patescibacteria group bacterium]
MPKKSKEEDVQILCFYAVLSAEEKDQFSRQLKATGIKVGINVTANYLQLHKYLIELHAEKYWMDRVYEMLTTGTMLEWRGRFHQACYLPRLPGVRS